MATFKGKCICVYMAFYSLHGAFEIGFKGGKFSDVLLVGFGYRTQNCGRCISEEIQILFSLWGNPYTI